MIGREALEAADNALLQDEHTSTHLTPPCLSPVASYAYIQSYSWFDFQVNILAMHVPPTFSSPFLPTSSPNSDLYASISCFPLLAIPVESLSFTPTTMSRFASIHCRQRSSSTSLRWSSSPPVAAPGHKCVACTSTIEERNAIGSHLSEHARTNV